MVTTLNCLSGLMTAEILSSERVELEDQICSLTKYDIEDYGHAEYIGDMEITSSEYRKSRSMIPQIYTDAAMEKFDWNIYGCDTGFQREIVNTFIERFEELKKASVGLYIYSKTKGSGKTFLACCIANEIMKRHDISVKFISVPEFLELKKKSYSDSTEKENLEAIKNASLLILDDIGAETKKDWADAELFDLIDYRYGKRLLTLFTSNLSVEKLELNARTIDRIYDMAQTINLPEVPVRKTMADKRKMDVFSRLMNKEEACTVT